MISYFHRTNDVRHHKVLYSNDFNRPARPDNVITLIMMRTPRQLNKPAVPPIAAARISKAASTCDKAPKHPAFTASTTPKLERVRYHFDVGVTESKIQERDFASAVIVFHKREEELLATVDSTGEENMKLKDEISRLQRFLHQRDEDHAASIKTAKKQSFKAGADAVVDEIQELWSSNEFAAEMMYGEKIELCCCPRSQFGCCKGGRGQTHESYDAIRHLMGSVYVDPLPKKKGWRKRRFEVVDRAYPAPLCSKTASKFADTMCRDSGLKEYDATCGGGAFFNAEKILQQLVESLDCPPTHIHVQVLGGGFRAMRSTSIVSVGARLLIESEEEAGDTSFTSIGSL